MGPIPKASLESVSGLDVVIIIMKKIVKYKPWMLLLKKWSAREEKKEREFGM